MKIDKLSAQSIQSKKTNLLDSFCKINSWFYSWSTWFSKRLCWSSLHQASSSHKNIAISHHDLTENLLILCSTITIHFTLKLRKVMTSFSCSLDQVFYFYFSQNKKSVIFSNLCLNFKLDSISSLFTSISCLTTSCSFTLIYV